MSVTTPTEPVNPRHLVDPEAVADSTSQTRSIEQRPPPHWLVQTASGLTLAVPPSLRSMTSFVLLEQERWFEPEMSLLPHLLQGGVHALDIGANHGLVALEMARCSGSGRVFAFEPTQAPRQALLRSVELNGLQDRLTVIDAALADERGSATFSVQDNSELNARQANVVGTAAGMAADTRSETVRVETLDGVMQTLGVRAATLPIGFIKLDAEGDELRVLAGGQAFFAEQSPVVMFEFKHGAKPNWPLLQAFEALGFGLFRWSEPLQLLLPFDPETAETAFALNLLALRQPQQQHWADRGLLVLSAALAEAQLPRASETIEPGWDWCFAACQRAFDTADQELSPAQRVASVIEARQQLLQATQATPPQVGVQAWVLLVRCMHALGEPLAAVQLAAALLGQLPRQAWAQGCFSECLPPLREQQDLPRHGSLGDWLYQMLAEFVATRRAWSSYFEQPLLPMWQSLLEHPDHSAEIERRYLLAHVRRDQVAPLSALQHLHHLQRLRPEQDRNATLWCGLLQSMRLLGLAAASVSTDGVAAAAGQLPSPQALLQQLPVAALRIVDVGASMLAHATTPYDSLLASGRAHVTGFEPDPQALAELQMRAAEQPHLQYLPSVVGNGQPATFHETEWSLTASLLPPNRAWLDRYHRLGVHVVEKSRRRVDTVRLDEVITPGGMDLLKIDVQGAEHLVFEGAPDRLTECLMVWTEVEFVPLYQGQPLFGDIEAQLRAHGLQFLCFADVATRTLASWPQAHGLQPPRQQQLWADAIFVPAPERIATLGADALARLALLAHHVAQSWDLCHAALMQLDAINGGSSGHHWAPRYLASLQAQG